jgi:hypothetical protein
MQRADVRASTPQVIRRGIQMTIDVSFFVRLFPLPTLLVLACCSGPAPQTFLHEFATTATPWTHDRFDDQEGKFTFAIISDLQSGDREGVFKVAVAQLSLLRPELILSVGDLIEGGSEDRATLAREWDDFDARASQARAPVFYVGGNHDLTNQTMRDVWIERYGARYYHFVYKDVLFLVLDTEDYTDERMQEIYLARAAALEVEDPEEYEQMEYYWMPETETGEIGRNQSEYFRKIIADNPHVRWTMLFMHKPVWQREDEPDFAAIESALSDRPYTVFNGHFHIYSHTLKNGRDYIMLGTTGGEQTPDSDMSFDHVTLVTMSGDGPSIAHLRLDGVLDKTGHVPAGGDSLCFQASKCGSGK